MTKNLFMYKFLILIGFIIFSKNSYSQYVTIQGNADCGTWINARSPNADSIALEHYAQGFLNGMILVSGFDFWKKPYDLPKIEYLKTQFLFLFLSTRSRRPLPSL